LPVNAIALGALRLPLGVSLDHVRPTHALRSCVPGAVPISVSVPTSDSNQRTRRSARLRSMPLDIGQSARPNSPDCLGVLS